MTMIRESTAGADTLLGAYASGGNYTDCYDTTVPGHVTLDAFVEAFYTSRLFRIERRLLGWFAGRPADDHDARRLAAGKCDTFAVWQVEDRKTAEILLRDEYGATRSWLMASPLVGEPDITQLRFGSAVIASKGALGRTTRLLLGLHRVYSRALLNAARRKLTAAR